MKLDSFDLHLTMPQAHDDVIRREGGYFKTRWQRFALYNQRMIATSFEVILEPFEDGPPVMADLRGFAVHQLGRAHNAAAKRLTYGLMAQTHAENRHPAGEMFDDL